MFKIQSLLPVLYDSENKQIADDSVRRKFCCSFFKFLEFANSLMTCIIKYLHFSKPSLDEPLDVHLCSYFHEQHRVT